MRSTIICLLIFFVLICQTERVSAQQLLNGGKYSGVRSRVDKEMGVTRLRLAQLKMVQNELKVTAAQHEDLQKADIYLNGLPISWKGSATAQIVLVQFPNTRPPSLNVPGGKDPSDVRDQFREKEIKKINDHVSKELELLEKILKAGQLKRLNEIYFQLRGAKVFLEDQVAADLKLTDEQVLAIYQAIADLRGNIMLAMQGQFKSKTITPQSANDLNKQKEEFRAQASQQVVDILSKDQMKQYKKMRGKNFQFSDEMKEKMFGQLYE
ncbi:MAG: hypothetical protein R3C11_16990 [Planctomycetaceae bacterium]